MRELTYQGVTLTDYDCEMVLAFAKDGTRFIPECCIITPSDPKRLAWKTTGRIISEDDLLILEDFINEWYVTPRSAIKRGQVYYTTKDLHDPYTATNFVGSSGSYLGVNADGACQWVSLEEDVYIRAPIDPDRVGLMDMQAGQRGYFLHDVNNQCKAGDRFIALGVVTDARWVALDKDHHVPRCIEGNPKVKKE